jgi:hypothetical protein
MAKAKTTKKRVIKKAAPSIDSLKKSTSSRTPTTRGAATRSPKKAGGILAKLRAKKVTKDIKLGAGKKVPGGKLSKGKANKANRAKSLVKAGAKPSAKRGVSTGNSSKKRK